MAKRKRSGIVDQPASSNATDTTALVNGVGARRSSARGAAGSRTLTVDANPKTNSQVLDGIDALRASPDAQGRNETFKVDAATSGKKRKGSNTKVKAEPSASGSSLSSLSDLDAPLSPLPDKKPAKSAAKKAASSEMADPEADDADEPADEEEVKAALLRPPPVDSDYLPLPWKGRLGYACLNTYLRAASTPVFSSRTCRIASILEHRHPLADPTQPEHATKNRPDKNQPASIERGQRYVEALGLANARDIPKMLRWNDRYGIKFLRLSSEMFPFASHDEYGYKLAPFASETLAEAGKVAAELGHRLTTHPGQFTQLGSPRKVVIDNAIRDLEYHSEMLSLLKLPEQQNRDAVMILHMGGMFGDKAATLDRFRENYQRLNQNMKNRLVLENDDMGWSVHDLLPICEEMNIPMVLDFHHHNIVFDETQIREGTKDIMDLYDRIAATWKRKGITQKMHYSEPTPKAITPQQRRKHSPRVKTLPPCAPNMDLMIEAKDKEQAVFELMRIFKLPGWNSFNDITPYVRQDENKPWKPPPRKKTPKKKKAGAEDEVAEEPEAEPQPPPIVPEDEVNMGGPDGRVYWPPGMEEWLRPKKREIKKKDPSSTPAKAKATPKKEPAIKDEEVGTATPAISTKASKAKGSSSAAAITTPVTSKSKATPTVKTSSNKKAKYVPTPSASDEDEDEDKDFENSASDTEDAKPVVAAATKTAVSKGKRGMAPPPPRPAPIGRRQSGRNSRKNVASYAEEEEDEMEVDVATA